MTQDEPNVGNHNLQKQWTDYDCQNIINTDSTKEEMPQ